MKQIPLTQGKFALVDDEDFECLNQFKWFYNNGYAVRLSRKEEYVDGKRTMILMHRVVNNTPDGVFTDHVDTDRLNNQKLNLRDCTIAENGMNRKSNRNSTSKFKGVSWYKKSRKWRSGIKLNRKTIHLGNFDCEIEAAKAYNVVAIEHHGEYARLNEF